MPQDKDKLEEELRKEQEYSREYHIALDEHDPTEIIHAKEFLEKNKETLLLDEIKRLVPELKPSFQDQSETLKLRFNTPECDAEFRMRPKPGGGSTGSFLIDLFKIKDPTQREAAERVLINVMLTTMLKMHPKNRPMNIQFALNKKNMQKSVGLLLQAIMKNAKNFTSNGMPVKINGVPVEETLHSPDIRGRSQVPRGAPKPPTSSSKPRPKGGEGIQ